MAANLAARRARLLGGSAVALVAALAGARTAQALDECGAAAPGGTVTCTPAGNNFPNGIQYKVDDLTIVVQDGVIIDTTTKAGEPGGVASGGNGNYGDLVVKVGTASGSGVTITTNENDADGISVATNDGSATITSFADITTSFKNGDAISAKTTAGDISITSTGDLDVDGFYGHGIRALSDTGEITITHTGDIETYGTGGFGIRAITKNDIDITVVGDITVRSSAAILAQASAGNVTVHVTGDVSTKDDNSSGLQAVAKDGGAFVTQVGSIITHGEGSEAIDAEGSKGVEIRFTGEISTDGKDATGINAKSTAGGISIKSDGDITVDGYGSRAILAVAENEIVITSTGDLTTGGTYGAGIFASSNANSVTITHTGDISTKGNGGDGIGAFAEGGVSITFTGNITTAGLAQGIDAYSVTDDVSVTSTGNISTAADNADGINAFAKDGAVFITSVGGITTKGDGADGIAATADGEGVILKSTGNISTAGEYAVGIIASSKIDAVTITSSGTIVTSGDGSDGIAGYGSYVGIVHAGNVVTAGENAEAIRAVAGNDSVNVQLTGAAVTSGEGAVGIFARSTDAGVRITSSGDVLTTGKSAHGIDAASKDVTTIYAGNVITTGRYSSGIFVHSTTENRVTVSGTVLGGWDEGVGVFLDQSKASSLTIEIGGAVGALSDFAIDQDDDNLTLSNNGAIVGSFLFDDGDDKLANFERGAVTLRQFADTDGDLTRDKESVAIGDFGADTDSFDNRGVLRLGSANGATMWDTTGQIAHPGGGNSDITQDGVEQGFLINLESFANSGLITLQDGVAGDLLVITDQADGKTKGANIFTSNGGGLALDAVLDDGSSKQSDVLILDKAESGTGATRVFIANAGGQGGQTTGDGILVINVRDKSDADAFASAGPAVAGAYQYDLVFQNAAKTDQNWYLQSSFFEGSLEYPAIGGTALATWQSGLGSLHDQLRARRAQTVAQEAALGQVAELPNTATDVADASAVRVGGGGGPNAGWFRVSGADMDIDQDAGADFNLNTVRAEAGFDVGFNNVLADDWLVAGAFAGYGWSSADFDSGSDVDFDIATVGAYATYFRGPYYLDAVVKLDWLDGDFTSENVSQDGDLSLPVFGVSLESGYRFDLTPNGLYLQPQAQLSYAHSGSDSIKDDAGSKIELKDADSLRGRLAARLGQELSTNAGAAAEPVKGNFYLEASVNQEFLGETEARVSGLTLQQELPETTYQVGGGFDIALPKSGLSFTVDADYTFGEDADGVSATGGFRINW